jgi:hypothetical protein
MKSINITKHFANYIKQIKVKETKVNPIESSTGLEGSRRLRLPHFNRHMKVIGLPAVRTSRLNLQEIFPVLISVR